jgi:hypothetical protein
MVSVLVVNSQEMPALVIELPATPAADKTMDLERPLSIVGVGRLGLNHFLDDFINGFATHRLLHLRVSSEITVFH